MHADLSCALVYCILQEKFMSSANIGSVSGKRKFDTLVIAQIPCAFWPFSKKPFLSIWISFYEVDERRVPTLSEWLRK